MIKVLSIGNSFSQDAHRYLHKVAKNEGVDMKCVNLYIGGCSLRSHFLNIIDNNKAYNFEFNGENTGIKVTIKEALASDKWDYVTIQQVSLESFDFKTYEPYIKTVADLIRLYSPEAKILIHQTWGYENGSERLLNAGFSSMKDMTLEAKKAYKKAAKFISADGIIPSGDAVQKAADMGLLMHRDTFHLSRSLGRYLVSCVWYKFLTGSTPKNKFYEFDEECNEKDIDKISEIAEEI